MFIPMKRFEFFLVRLFTGALGAFTLRVFPKVHRHVEPNAKSSVSNSAKDREEDSRKVARVRFAMFLERAAIVYTDANRAEFLELETRIWMSLMSLDCSDCLSREKFPTKINSTKNKALFRRIRLKTKHCEFRANFIYRMDIECYNKFGFCTDSPNFHFTVKFANKYERRTQHMANEINAIFQNLVLTSCTSLLAVVVGTLGHGTFHWSSAEKSKCTVQYEYGSNITCISGPRVSPS